MLRLLFSNEPAARWERALIKATLIRHWSAFRRGLSLDALIFALRDDVTPTKLATNSDITAVAGVAINTTNGTRVLVNLGKIRRTVISVTNTAAATKVVTVKKATTASENPVSDYSTIAIPITTGEGILGPFNGKYVQADGGIYLDFVAGHTGVVRAYELPG